MRRSAVSKVVTAGLVAMGITAAALPAHAVVVYSGTVNIAVPNTFDGLFLNVVTGSNFAGPGFPALGGAGSNYDINLFGATTWSLFSPGSSGQSTPTPVPTTSKGYVAGSATGDVLNLATGTLIGGASIFNTGSPGATALATGTATLLGFRFRNEGPDLTVSTDDTVHYGWARFRLSSGSPGTLIDYAFESTPLTAIAAGVTAPIPEPASVAMWGAGLLGLVTLAQRRRRPR
jgi:MYXO-CTERM domain-containing protein